MTELQLQCLVEKLSLEKFKKKFQHRAYFNERLRTTGGRYLLHTHHIEINPVFYETIGEQELTGIILHELCHYHLHIEGKGYQHRDLDFKQLLKRVGAPRFCASLPIEDKKVYHYQCINCSQYYIRKRKMALKKYRCGKCKGEIILL